MSIYQSAVKKPITTALIYVAIAIFGIFSIAQIPIDLLPDIETNSIMVMTTYEGASASDIENNVTKPLENTLNSVSDLKHITSQSKENISIITLEFEYGIDIDVATNDVRDKLDMVTSALPDEVETPIIFKFGTDDIPILLLSVTADESTSGLYKILDDRISNPLARVSGVGAVSVSGAPKRELMVYCDPHKLEAYGISIQNIVSIISAENRNIPGGSIDIGSQTYSLRVQKEFTDASEMLGLVLGSYNGKTIYLRDVATVVDGLEERAQETYNNLEKGGMIIIQKQSGANSVNISKKVMEMLPSLQENLPSDIKIGVIVDTSENIINTINSLVETIITTFILVMLVVYAFLGRWRATFIIVLVIPISLLASLIYIFATGDTLNIISLSSLSIAIGMVVDDAIVVLENITTHIERGSRPKQAADYDPYRAGKPTETGGGLRYQRGGYLRYRLYPHHVGGVPAHDNDPGCFRSAFQAVGMECKYHHDSLYIRRFVSYPDALLADAASQSKDGKIPEAGFRTYKQGVGRNRQRLCKIARMGRTP